MIREVSRQAASTVFEGMTSIRAVIKSHLAGTNDRRIEKVLVDKEKYDSKKKDVDYLASVSDKLGFKIEICGSDKIDEITTGNSHGGIVACCSERTIPAIENIKIGENGFYVMIEGIEDPYNFGYAIRSIYAAGADGLILTPRNWMSAAGVVCRSSAGASELIPVYVSDPADAVKFFTASGYKTAAAGIRDSVSAYDADLSLPLFLIVGGEKRGISRSVLDLCDMTVRLDYGREFKASLSAASAASILAYEVFRQNKKRFR